LYLFFQFLFALLGVGPFFFFGTSFFLFSSPPPRLLLLVFMSLLKQGTPCSFLGHTDPSIYIPFFSFPLLTPFDAVHAVLDELSVRLIFLTRFLKNVNEIPLPPRPPQASPFFPPLSVTPFFPLVSPSPPTELFSPSPGMICWAPFPRIYPWPGFSPSPLRNCPDHISDFPVRCPPQTLLQFLWKESDLRTLAFSSFFSPFLGPFFFFFFHAPGPNRT